MKNKIKAFLILALAVSALACQQKPGNNTQTNNVVKTQPEKEEFLTIPFAKIIQHKQDINLSEFANDVEFIQFENTPKALLGRVSDIKLTKDYIFIRHTGNKLITQFTRNGKYLRHIGKLGRGPKEYALSRVFSLDEKKQHIYIQTNWTRKILVYNFDGEYVKTIKYKAVERSRNVWCRDNVLVSFGDPHIGNEPYVFIEHNENGDTLQSTANHNFWDKNETSHSMVSFWELNAFYRFNNKLHMKGWYNDTVYSYNAGEQIVPKFSIDFGEHKIPMDLVYERKSTKPMPANACWAGVHETNRYIFLPYGYHYNMQARKVNKEEMGYVLFDKSAQTGVAVKEAKQTGFINDITGGPNFYPQATNDTCAFVTVSALTMKQYLDSEEFKNQETKFPEQKEKLQKLNNTLKEDDNHFLVIVKLKD